MKALLLIAHGSRVDGYREEIQALTDKLTKQMPEGIDIVRSSYLELTEPRIPAVIDEMVAQGVKEIMVFPYLLATGRHLREDIPEVIEQKREQYPDVCFRDMPYLGIMDRLPELIVSSLAGEMA